MLINLPIHNCKILTERPVLNQLGPVKTKTGLKTAKDCGLSLFAVWSGLFQFQDKGRPGSVSVPKFWGKKPDQTGLPSTKNYEGWVKEVVEDNNIDDLICQCFNFHKWDQLNMDILPQYNNYESKNE